MTDLSNSIRVIDGAFGFNLRAARVCLHLSQKFVAEETGIKIPQIRKIESNYSFARSAAIKKLLDFYKNNGIWICIPTEDTFGSVLDKRRRA